MRQPGEPTASTFQFDNPGGEQALHWILTAEDGEAFAVKMTLDAGESIDFPGTLRQGWSLRYEGGTTVTVHDADNRPVGSIDVAHAAFDLGPGRHSIRLDSSLRPEQQAKARLELRPRGRAERVVVAGADGAHTREEQ